MSVLIPVFSEVASLETTVDILLQALPQEGLEILLLVHRDSIPDCWQLCQRLAEAHPQVRVHRQLQYPGQGYAYREGIEMARGDYLLFMNSDLETEPSHAIRLLTAMQTGDADIVVGSRWAPGANFDWRSYGLLKWVLNFFVQQFFARLLRVKVSDLTFAFKIARAHMYRNIIWQGSGHEFVFEAAVKPALLGFRLSEVPTQWIGRQEGVSHQPMLRNFRHIRLALSLWAEHWRNPAAFRERYWKGC